MPSNIFQAILAALGIAIGVLETIRDIVVMVVGRLGAAAPV